MAWQIDPETGRYKWIDEATGAVGIAPPGTAPPPDVGPAGYRGPASAGLAPNRGAGTPIPPRPAGVPPDWQYVAATDSWMRPDAFTAQGGALPGSAAPSAAPAPTIPTAPRRPIAEVERRIAMLLRGGMAPEQINYQVIDNLGPYPYAGPDQGGADTGGTYINPEEIKADQWLRTFLAGQQQQGVANSGMYWDQATGQWRPTAGYGLDLINKFGGARQAEQNYQRAFDTQHSAEAGASQQVQAAQSQLNRATAAGDTAGIQQAQAGLNAAQNAYNRVRGQVRYIEKPLGVADLGTNTTDEQFGAYQQALQSQYSPDEWEQLMRGPNAMLGRPNPRQQAAYEYRRAAMARGML